MGRFDQLTRSSATVRACWKGSKPSPIDARREFASIEGSIKYMIVIPTMELSVL